MGPDGMLKEPNCGHTARKWIGTRRFYCVRKGSK